MKKLLIALIILLPLTASASWYNPFSWGPTLGATVLSVPQGGTGAQTFPAGECLKGNGTGAITTGSCGGGGGDFPFTVNTGYNSTSTVIGFNGLFSTASSTFSSNIYFPSLTQGFAYIGSSGKLNTTASSSINLSWFNNDAGFLTSSGASAFEVATTSDIAVSQVGYFTKTSGMTTLGSVATGTIAVPTGLTSTAGRYVLGGNLTIGLDTGYVIPLQSTLDAKLSSYDAWTHGAAGKSATTSAIGIGSSTPWGMLSVTQTGTDPAFIVEDSASPDTSPFIITATGNVGIGTTGPGNKLSVNGAADVLTLGIGITTNPTYYLDVQATAVNSQFKSTTGTNTAYTKWVNGSNSLYVGAEGSAGGTLGTNSLPYAGVVNSSLSALQLAANNSVAMTILTNGNVGIGTTAPVATLHVAKSGLSLGTALFRLGNPSQTVSTWDWAIDSNSSQAILGIKRTQDANYAMVLEGSSGNVGIGTTGPREALDVNGNIITAWSDTARIGTQFSDGTLYQNGLSFSASNRTTNIDALTNGADSEIVFRTGTVASPSEKMRIQYDGNVGIGTTGPLAKLGIAGVTGTPGNTDKGIFQVYASDNNVGLSIGNYVAANYAMWIQSMDNRSGFSTAYPIALNPLGGNVSVGYADPGTAKLAINGDVGIGTTTPNFKLVSTNSTGPQLSLSAGAGLNQWVMRNEGGQFALATSTYTATSSVSALRIDSNGKVRANCFTNDGTTCITSGATVAGSDTQVQFNDGGSALGGDAGLVFNKTNDTLTTVNASTTRLSASEYATIGTTTRHSTLTIQADINDGTALKMFESPGGTYNGYWSWIFGGDGDFGLQLVDAQASEPSNIFSIQNTNDSYTPFKIGFREKYVGLNDDLFTSYQPSGRSGFGTTTPTNVLTLATTTAPQLSLSSGAGVSQWTMRNAGGNLYIATTSVAGTATSTTAAIRVDTNGAVYLNNLRTSTAGNAICYLAGNELVVSGGTTCATSALKGKTDIEDITKEQALGILDMKPVEYTLKENGQRRYGFIADWIKDEKLVEYTPDGEINGFDYLRYTALLTKLVQEQQKQIDNIVVGVVDTAQEKWQWGAIIALFGLIAYQQIQIRKMKSYHKTIN